nr:MAG TPA: beta-glucosidase [Bacteriophage sp.]
MIILPPVVSCLVGCPLTVRCEAFSPHTKNLTFWGF